MAFALIAQTWKEGADSASVTTDPINTLAADLITVIAINNNANTTENDLSDSSGNTAWVKRSVAINLGTAGSRAVIYDLKKTGPVTFSATHTFSLSSVSSSYPQLKVYAWSGSAAAPFDQESVNSLTSGSAIQPRAGAALTPTSANALVLTAVGYWNDPSSVVLSGAGFSTPDTHGAANIPSSSAYYIQSTATAVDPEWQQAGSGPSSSVLAIYLDGAAVITPSITSINASPIYPNVNCIIEVLSFTITGTNLDATLTSGARVTFSNSNVTVNFTSSSTATAIVMDILVAANASPNVGTVTVHSDAGNATVPFTIAAAGAGGGGYYDMAIQTEQKYANATSQSIEVKFINKTTGDGLTGLTSSAVTAYSRRGYNGASTVVTLSALSGPTAAWSAGGFVEVDAVHKKGSYRFDPPNPLIATGVPCVYVDFAATGAPDPVTVKVELLGYDPYAVPPLLTTDVGGNVFVAGGGISAAAFTADTAKYQAKVWMIPGSTTDHYLAAMFKNGEPVFAGITVPTIWVYSNAGADLVGTSASPATLTQISATGTYTRDEATNRLVVGSAYFARIRFTLDGTARNWIVPVGRPA